MFFDEKANHGEASELTFIECQRVASTLHRISPKGAFKQTLTLKRVGRRGGEGKGGSISDPLWFFKNCIF